MSNQNLKITITGGAGMGKSTILSLLGEFLQGNGATVSCIDEGLVVAPGRFGAESLEGLSVKIVTNAALDSKVSSLTIAGLQDADHLPKTDRYTSVSKGGSYTKLGAIRGAGALKGLAGIAYQNDKGDLFIREPECFAKRMVLVEQGGAS